MSVDAIWNAVRKVKVKTPFDLYCNKYGLYKEGLGSTNKQGQVEAVEMYLKIDRDTQIRKNMTNKELKTAAEMFIYLNTCTEDNGEIEGWFKSWFKFYDNLFRSQNSEMIILTLNRMMKINREGRVRAKKLFNAVTNTFSLKYQHIHSIIPGKAKNVSFKEEKSSVESFNTENNFYMSFISHPVHITTSKANQLSPSAFIPFCEFGGNMSTVGIKIDQFDVPVCNSFQSKILNDQLCYEIGLLYDM